MSKRVNPFIIRFFLILILGLAAFIKAELPDYILSEVRDVNDNVVGFYDNNGEYHTLVIKTDPYEEISHENKNIISKSIDGINTKSTPGIKFIDLNAYDLVYNPFENYIYASVQSSDSSYGNSIVKINPTTGSIENSVFVGSEPRKLAISSDGEYIYIGLYGAGSISRYYVPTGVVDKTFSLGTGSYGATYAEDIAVQPGNNKVIAVSRFRKGISPRHDGVAIYDDGIELPQKTRDHTGSNVIEFSDEPEIVYGYCNETTNYGVYTNFVNENGISQIAQNGGLISGFGTNFEYDDGFIYSTSGRVIDTSTMTLVGQFSSSGHVEPDADIRRTFYINGTIIKAFNQKTFLETGTFSVSGISGSARNLIRWGNRGLAFCSSNGDVVILETDLVVDPPVLTSLEMLGPDHVDTYKADYNLIAKYDDGVELDVTNKSKWYTNPDDYTELNSSGTLAVFGTEQPGETTILAEYAWAGKIHTVSKEITFEGTIPANGNMIRLEINGPDQVVQNTETQYSAVAFFDDDTAYDVTSSCIWTMEDSKIANIGEKGKLSTGEVDRYRDIVVYAKFGHKYTELETVKTILCTPDIPQTSTNNWPMYQCNAKHNGYVPIALNPEEFSLRWEKQIGDSRSLNPISAANGKVFVSVQSRFANNGDNLFALDSRDGETLWKINDLTGSSSINPPSYSYGNVYIQTGKGTSSGPSSPYIHCFKADTGEVIFKSQTSAQWESYLAPTIYDGSVYINGGYYGGMYGFDAFTGDQHWFKSLAQEDNWTPAVEGKYSYAFLKGTLTAIDRLYGTVAFSITHRSSYNHNVPVIGNFNNIFSTNSGYLVCFDLNTRELAYEIEGKFTSVPSIAKNVVYVINNGSLEARNEIDGDFIWSWSPPEGRLTDTMIATESHIIARTSNNTYAVEILSHEQDWSYPASGYLALANDSIYIAQSNGTLTSIATPEYIPAQPVKVEIEGPLEIFENTSNTYQAKVTYSDGRVRNRTALSDWAISSSVLHTFDEGIFETGELLQPEELVTFKVAYTQEGTTVDDELDVLVKINTSINELIERNATKTIALKNNAVEELTKALDIEYATMATLKGIYNEPDFEDNNTNLALRKTRDVIVMEKNARQIIKESSQDIYNSLLIFNGQADKSLLDSTNNNSPEILEQISDINSDGIINLIDLEAICNLWLSEL